MKPPKNNMYILLVIIKVNTWSVLTNTVVSISMRQTVLTIHTLPFRKKCFQGAWSTAFPSKTLGPRCNNLASKIKKGDLLLLSPFTDKKEKYLIFEAL